jgi:hypothetical protein
MILRYGLALFLILHGLVHLIGFMRARRSWSYDSWPYRTTVLGGRIEIGERGTLVLGWMWLFAIPAFIVAGIGLFVLASCWVTLTGVVATISLLLCLLEWPDLWPGMLINVAILALLFVGNQIPVFIPT